MGRVPGIGGSNWRLFSSAQPLSLVVLFHTGPYRAAFHIPRRPRESQWIKLKQQRFEWDTKQALLIAWDNMQEWLREEGCAWALSQEEDLQRIRSELAWLLKECRRTE